VIFELVDFWLAETSGPTLTPLSVQSVFPWQKLNCAWHSKLYICYWTSL